MKNRTYKQNLTTGENNFETIYETCLPLLQKQGHVKTDQAWQLCCRKIKTYGTLAYHFKKIMDSMVEYNKAEQIKEGQWLIIKPEPISK